MGLRREGPEEYLEKLGKETQERLKPGVRLSAPVNYGSY
jgi:hypothetical protein